MEFNSGFKGLKNIYPLLFVLLFGVEKSKWKESVTVENIVFWMYMFRILYVR